jgi:hypothetical protein
LVGLILIAIGAVGFLMTYEAGVAFFYTPIAGVLSYVVSGLFVLAGILVAWRL